MYKRILVPLDGSKLAEIALPHAESIAGQYESELILMSVVNPPPAITERDVTSIRMQQQLIDEHWKESEFYLKGLKGEFAKKNIKTETVVKLGPVVDNIVNTAENMAVDLVLIASHGLTGLKQVFFGSVAAGILNRIEQPLLIIRSAR
jgi:nucleotide-binding universal stress UspA family protein